MTGRTISHYQVLELLGSGGMGEVYKGRDTRLNRPVALKVLRPERMSQASRKQRFIQEAQAASALNHPNIVTIYDIGEENGIDFMVMEYIPGRTIDALIPRNGMRLNEVLRIAIQIAEGLRRAHSAGIAHRDLKPSNIIVSDEGLVKILDFGLAKLVEEAPPSADEATRTQRPETEEGTVLGTVAYMSPEQAEGRKLDVRTDIFSFGVMLYEMLTGRKPFGGDSRLSTMSAILKEEPKALENVPGELDKIIRRCLRKDRDKRIQHMDDVKLALEEVREDSESGKMGAADPPARAPKRWTWAAAGVAAAGLLGAGLWSTRSKPATNNRVAALSRVTSDAGLATTPAISLDGKLLAFASDRATDGENLDIWLQHLGGGEAVRLTKEDGDETDPNFSPDGSQVAYVSSRGGIWVVPTLGGEPRQLVSAGSRPRYSPDGKWLAYHTITVSAGELPGQTWIIPAGGGQPKQLAPSFRRALWPVWSPRSDSLLVQGLKDASTPGDWWLLRVDGGEAVPCGFQTLAAEGNLRRSTPAAWHKDHLLFSVAGENESRLMWLRADPASGKCSGPVEAITSGTSRDAYPSVSSDGRIAFASEQFRSDLWMLPADTNGGKVTGPMQRLTEDSALNDTPSISEDGTKLAFRSNRDGMRSIWLRDMTSGKLRKVSSNSARVPNGPTFPGISADGRTASFEVLAESGPSKDIVANLEDGSLREIGTPRGWGLSPSASYLLTYDKGRSAAGRIRAINLRTNQDSYLLDSNPGAQRSPHLSPDEKWLAMHILNTESTRRILVAPFQFGRPAPEAEWIYITDGKTLDRDPQWSPDGNILYWLADRDGARGIHAVRLDPATKRPRDVAFEVKMFRGARRSMMPFDNTAACRAAIAKDKIVFALGETTGNIWTTRLPDSQ